MGVRAARRFDSSAATDCTALWLLLAAALHRPALPVHSDAQWTGWLAAQAMHLAGGDSDRQRRSVCLSGSLVWGLFFFLFCFLSVRSFPSRLIEPQPSRSLWISQPAARDEMDAISWHLAQESVRVQTCLGGDAP